MTYFRKDVHALGRRDVGSGGRTTRSDRVIDGLVVAQRRLERIAGTIAPWLTALITILASLALAFRM